LNTELIITSRILAQLLSDSFKSKLSGVIKLTEPVVIMHFVYMYCLMHRHQMLDLYCWGVISKNNYLSVGVGFGCGNSFLLRMMSVYLHKAMQRWHLHFVDTEYNSFLLSLFTLSCPLRDVSSLPLHVDYSC